MSGFAERAMRCGHLIKKFIEIDAAHRVPLHESKCKNLHGHRYKIQANVFSEELGAGAEDGMVWDYSKVKQLLVNYVDGLCDHGIILSINDRDMLFLAIGQNELLSMSKTYAEMEKAVAGPFKCWSGKTEFGKTFVIPYVPTAENLARFFYEMLRERVVSMTGGRAELHSITVWETPTSEATYPILI